jgi:hypothetical protein
MSFTSTIVASLGGSLALFKKLLRNQRWVSVLGDDPFGAISPLFTLGFIPHRRMSIFGHD